MAKVELSGREKRGLVLWVLAGIVGLWYAHAHFFEAFPEASVNFKVTRAEALEKAHQFVTALGQNIEGYRPVIVFGVDDNAKTYLERQVGLKEANQMMASQVNVWDWEVRFFKPGQEEEYQVGVSPEGYITGYAHKIPEAQAGAQLERDAAQKIAQEFLTAKLGKPAGDWDFLPEEANSEKKPNRLDWSFTWEMHGFKAKDAPERLHIVLHGDAPGSAKEALKVPEQWERDYAHLRSTNVFYNQLAFIPYLLLFGAAFWQGIQLTRSGQTSWSLALKLGVLTAVFLTAMQLNRWPVDLMQYDTNSAYGSFAIQQLLGALLFGVGSALTVSLVLPGGEPLYRAARPQFLQLRQAFTARGVRSKQFFSSCVVGISLAAAQMGFLVAFYLVANHFGAWAPQDVNYEDSVSTAIPWVGGLAIGLLAATSEEFLFRLFAIPFLQRLTKSNVIAVVLPAFMWGFLHTAYPNEPPYIRGLEVGLIGIAVGTVMLHWGILATLMWHYTVDASLVGLLLIRSHSWYFRISGIAVGLAVLIPFGMAVYWRVQRGTFEDDADLLNGAAEPEKEAETAESAAAPDAASGVAGMRGYSALSNATLGVLGLCLILGMLAAWKVKPQRLGDYLKLSINAKEATARGSQILRDRGVDPQGYKTATVLVNVTDGTASEYLREKVGMAALNEIYDKKVPGALWNVRFFRDGKAEEYSVVLRPDGTLHSVHHDLAEADSGASLSKDEAQAKAQDFLRAVKNIDLSGWTLVEATSDKKPKRVDHKFIWQQNQPLDDSQAGGSANGNDHAYARMQVLVEGDEPTSYRTFIKIPDEWRRQREQQSLARTILSVLPILLVVGLGVTVLVFFLREIRSPLMKALPWRRFALWGLWAAAAYLAVFVFGDRVAETLSQYQTAMPLKFMYGVLGIGVLVGTFFFIGAITLLFAMGWFFLRQAFGQVELPGWRGMPSDYYRDALLTGVGGTGALLALRRGLEWVSTHWPTPHQSLGAAFGTDFEALLPAASISGAAVLHGLLYAGFIAVMAGFVAARCKSPVLRALLFVIGSLLLVGGWGNAADFAKQWIADAVLLGVVVAGVVYVARLNLLGYFLALAMPAVLGGCVEMLGQPNAFYKAQGVMCCVALAVLVVWPLVAWLAGKNAPSEPLAQTTAR